MALWKVLSFALVILIISRESEGKQCFSQLCKSNAGNAIRGCDSQGCGSFKARRGSRLHKGLDIKCSPGDDVYAPFPSKFIRPAAPYLANHKHYRKAFNTGILLGGTGAWKGFVAKIFYVKRTSGKNFNAGSKIGVYQELSYSGITQHIHIAIYKNGRLVDPTQFVC